MEDGQKQKLMQSVRQGGRLNLGDGLRNSVKMGILGKEGGNLQ